LYYGEVAVVQEGTVDRIADSVMVDSVVRMRTEGRRGA